MPRNTTHHRIDFSRDIFAILFLAMGVFVALCLISYSPTDPALNSVSNVEHVRNFGGVVGAYLADILFIIFGISAYATAVVLIVMSIMQFIGRPIALRLRQILFICGVIVFASALIHLRFESVTIRGHALSGGGIIGGLMGDILARYLNRPGAYVIAVSGLVLFFTLATQLTPRDMLVGIHRGTIWFGRNLFNGLAIFGRAMGQTTVRVARELRARIPTLMAALRRILTFKRERVRPPKAEATVMLDPVRRQTASREKSETRVHLEPIRKTSAAPLATKTTPATAAASTEADGPRILKRADTKARRASDEQLKFHMTAEGYEPPPLSLLDADERTRTEVDEETLKKNSLLLERKLLDFGVEGSVTAIHPGPVITMYEFEPKAGTKVSKISGLQDDLSLALGGRSVRIVGHLPGKAAVGVEIPNSERETVWLKDMIASAPFHKTNSKLPIPLGSSAAGHPMVVDLTKMPHLLVAGATGSGKSVGINSFIISILYKSAPADVRFLLVDPKMLELSVYDGIPHLLLPVVTKPKEAVKAMRWALREMEERYRRMANSGTRNIMGYNEKIAKGMLELVTEAEALEIKATDRERVVHTGKLPYIVIIIDELADLMMTASQEMEESITRLAQMARAAGIHLILATQRPSVDVITGLIKANFPARIAFKVTARHDSRTILDHIGAETLLGHGDMLFMSPQGGNMMRAHGPLVTDSDISRVVEHLKAQGAPVYNEEILKEPENAPGAGGSEGEEDEMYDQAVKLVAETKQASISMVQRRMRIGYNRAARMIERMEAEGVVGPPEGSKPRQVLINEI